MLYKVDVDRVPMLYIEADDFAELEQILKKLPLVQGYNLNSVSPIEEKCYIKKEQDMSCIGCKWENSCEKECVRNDYNDWYTKEV